jgi:cardiolipin synthase A/B
MAQARIVANLRRSRVHWIGTAVAASVLISDPACHEWRRQREKRAEGSGTPHDPHVGDRDRARISALLARVGFTEKEASRIWCLRIPEKRLGPRRVVVDDERPTHSSAPSRYVPERENRARDVQFGRDSYSGSRWRGGVLALSQALLTDVDSMVLPSTRRREGDSKPRFATIAENERRAAAMVARGRVMWTPEEQEYALASMASHIYLNTTARTHAHVAAGVGLGAGLVAVLSAADKWRLARFLLRGRGRITLIPSLVTLVSYVLSVSYLQREVVRHVDQALGPESLTDGISHAYLQQEWNRRMLGPLNWWRGLLITSTGVDLLDGAPSLAALERIREERESQLRGTALKASQPAIEEAVRDVFTPQLVNKLHPKIRERILSFWRQNLYELLPLGGTSSGNRVTIFANGGDSFRDMWRHIRNAQDRVWLETYIFEPDAIGLTTLQALQEAAVKCKDVRLTFDAVGSPSLTSSHLSDLIAAGADVVEFNPIIRWKWWRMKRVGFFRNHRKILLCDDVAFTGGRNVGVEYAAKDVGGTDWFRDTHIKIEGPAVAHLEDVFLNSLAETEHQKPVPSIPFLRRAEDMVLKPREEGEGTVHEDVWIQVLQSNVRRNKRHLQRAMRLVLREANEKCLISTPYFLPPGRLLKSMKQAARRGVDIRIITSGEACDAPLLRMAGRHVYKSLLAQGVRIYEYRGTKEHPQNVHAKVVTIDGVFSSIGSYNMDPLSDRHNLELSVCMLDPAVATTLEGSFESDLDKCEEIRMEDLEKSLFGQLQNWAMYQFFRLFNVKLPSSDVWL